MRVYLSGPMRGKRENHFPEFLRIANRLRSQNHDVLNPGESAIADRPGSVRSDYLRHDIQLILGVDAVVVIPGWLDSPGARFEVAQAWQIGIPVYFFQEFDVDVMGSPPEQRFVLEPLIETSVVIPRENQYVKRVPLIALSGFAGVGKDEIAKTLVSECGYTRVAFADPLKRIARELGWDGSKDEVGRRLLQNLGLGVRTHLYSDAWVQAAEDAIERVDGPVVLTDCRFPNEVMMVRRRQGTVVRVVRPGCGPVNEHVSEHAITDSDADVVFTNDGLLEDLPKLVRVWAESL